MQLKLFRVSIFSGEFQFDMIKSIEDRDFELVCRLFGGEYTEKGKNEFLKSYETKQVKENIILLLDNLPLFPKIGEIPEWANYVEFEYSYIKGSMEILVTAKFTLKNNAWIIKKFQPHDYSRDEEELKKKSRYISPPPPEGERKLDVGLNDIIKKFLFDLEKNNFASMRKYSAYDSKYDVSDFKKKESKFKELLSQFPSIGPIPAPAYMFRVLLKGAAEDEKVIMDAEFRWRDNKLRISDIDAYQRK